LGYLSSPLDKITPRTLDEAYYMAVVIEDNISSFDIGCLIQVDIGGHPPFPNGSKQLSGNFGNLLFLAGFNFRGHFEGPNEGFSRSRFLMIAKGMIEPPK
jgi:hypothetical protein